MNFFQQQEHARSKTRWLLFIYVLAVAAIVIALDAIFLLVQRKDIETNYEEEVFVSEEKTSTEHPGVRSSADVTCRYKV